MSTVHDFQASKAFSNDARLQALADHLLRQMHGEQAYIQRMNHDGGYRAAQHLGRDLSVHLPNGEQVFYDEKYDNYDNDRIVLEYLSSEEERKPGWIESSLSIHALLYVKVKRRQGYIWPWAALQRAWRIRREAWVANAKGGKEGYVISRCRNIQGFTTVSVCVPVHMVELAIRYASRVEAA